MFAPKLRSLFKILAASPRKPLPPRRMRRSRLRIEPLECRLVPATVFANGGSLFVLNPLSPSLTVRAIATDTFVIQDGPLPPVTGLGSNLTILGSNKSEAITVNLNGHTLDGNLNIVEGNGNDTVTLTTSFSSEGGGNAVIAGNVGVVTGTGNDQVHINNELNNNNAGNGPMTIQGRLAAVDTGGVDFFLLGNLIGITSVMHDVSISGYNGVSLGELNSDSFGGNVAVSLGNHPGFLLCNVGDGQSPVTIAGNLSISAGPLDDFVHLGGLTINKDLNVNLGGGSPSGQSFGVSLPPAAGLWALTTVKGNTVYTATGPVLDVSLSSGIFNGNVTLNMGDGTDRRLHMGTVSVQTVISGNLQVNAGNGNFTADDNINAIGPITAKIGGSVTFNLGTGDHSVTFANGSSVGGTLTYSGGGNNQLTLAGNQKYIVDVHFGSGNDTFTLNNAAASLQGFIDGGGGVNVFQNLAGTLGMGLVVINF